MAALSWIVCVACFLGGFAASTDLSRATGSILATGLFVASMLSCPVLWKMPLLRDALDGRQRMMACVALLLALPLVLLPAG